MAAIVGATGVLYARTGALVGDCGCIPTADRAAFNAWTCSLGSGGSGPGQPGFCPPQAAIDDFGAWSCSFGTWQCPGQGSIDLFNAWSCS